MRRKLLFVAIAIVLFAVPDFLPVAVARARTPAVSSLGYKEYTNLTYCSMFNSQQGMDLYVPTSGSGPYPLVLWVPGGGWKSTAVPTFNNPTFAWVAGDLLQAGIAVAAIDYLGYPTVTWPAQIEQPKCALRFLRAEASVYGLNSSEFGAYGRSVGGHLASLLGLTTNATGWDVGQYLNYSSAVSAVETISGPTNLTQLSDFDSQTVTKIQTVFGTSFAAQLAASPVDYMRSNPPNFLIVEGLNDTKVNYAQGVEFQSYLAANGVNSQLILANEAGHALSPVPILPEDPPIAVTYSNGINFFVDSLYGKTLPYTASQQVQPSLSTAGITVTSVAVGNGPFGIAFNPSNNYTYVANYLSGTVSVISGSSVVGTLNVGSKPLAPTFNPSNNAVYVANSGSGTVSVIDGTSVVATIPVGALPAYMVYDSSNSAMYVSNVISGTVTVIEGTRVTATVRVGSQPMGMAFDPKNHDVYVSNEASNTVSVISGTKVVATVDLGTGANNFVLAYDPSNNVVYVTNYGSSIISIIRGAQLVASPSAARGPGYLAFDPINNDMYVVDQEGGKVTIVSGPTLAASLTVGSFPFGAIFNPANNYVYVANLLDGTVSVLAGGKVFKTLSVGENPSLFAFDTATNVMYVTNYGSNTVSILTPS